MLKKLIRKIALGKKSDGPTYIKYLRSLGMKIGNHTNIWSPNHVVIDETKPWLIEIGNNVNITNGVKILTHDYSWSVIRYLDGITYGSADKVIIKDNVFIGMNAIITKGVTIESNVIIGAGSIVTKSLEGNAVYAGNPAKYICSLDEYREKLIERQEKEAINMAKEYINKYDKDPTFDDVKEFVFLFENNVDNIPEKVLKAFGDNGNFEQAVMKFKNNKPKYKGFDEFLRKVKNEK